MSHAPERRLKDLQFSRRRRRLILIRCEECLHVWLPLMTVPGFLLCLTASDLAPALRHDLSLQGCPGACPLLRGLARSAFEGDPGSPLTTSPLPCPHVTGAALRWAIIAVGTRRCVGVSKPLCALFQQSLSLEALFKGRENMHSTSEEISMESELDLSAGYLQNRNNRPTK